MLTEYMLDRMRSEAAMRGGQARLVRALGVSSAHVSNVLSGRSGIGFDLATKIAEHWGMTLPEVEATAQKRAADLEAAAAKAGPTTLVDPDDIYPERAVAAAVARLDGIREDAIESVLSIRRRVSADAPRLTWRDWHARMLVMAADLDEGREVGRPATDADIAKPKWKRKPSA